MKIMAQSLSEQVYDLVKSEILKGSMKGGEKISEDKLAEQFGVSRTPIREALRRLSEYGLISLSPRSHASVVKISKEAAKDIAELRVELEIFAVDHIDKALFDKMLAQISRYAADCHYAISVGERAKAFELDSLFHISLVKATRNEALIDIYNRLDAKIQLLRIEQNLPENILTNYLMQHNKLISLIKDEKIEEAKELIREHVTHNALS